MDINMFLECTVIRWNVFTPYCFVYHIWEEHVLDINAHGNHVFKHAQWGTFDTKRNLTGSVDIIYWTIKQLHGLNTGQLGNNNRL
jgi:hypothetical protein